MKRDRIFVKWNLKMMKKKMKEKKKNQYVDSPFSTEACVLVYEGDSPASFQLNSFNTSFVLSNKQRHTVQKKTCSVSWSCINLCHSLIQIQHNTKSLFKKYFKRVFIVFLYGCEKSWWWWWESNEIEIWTIRTLKECIWNL